MGNGQQNQQCGQYLSGNHSHDLVSDVRFGNDETAKGFYVSLEEEQHQRQYDDTSSMKRATTCVQQHMMRAGAAHDETQGVRDDERLQHA